MLVIFYPVLQVHDVMFLLARSLLKSYCLICQIFDITTSLIAVVLKLRFYHNSQNIGFLTLCFIEMSQLRKPMMVVEKCLLRTICVYVIL